MEGFRQLIELHLAEQEERDARKRQEKLREQIAHLDEQLSETRGKLEAAEGRRDEIVGRRRALEGEVEQLDASRSKYRAQLMEAKTNFFNDTATTEIYTAAKTISEKETSILELMESIETAEAVVAEAKGELDAAEGENRGEAQRLEAEVSRLEEVRAAARVKADAKRGEVPKRLLPTYDRILAARDSKALALCKGETCSECHVAVRPQVWVEILKEVKIHNCGGCGRILYREENLQAVPAGGDEASSTEGN
jgi:predicted  nucleic acid-binding Zn-ribbon protein